ncbi:MAG: nuclear transport factor 2 family protein [Methanomicrobiales archaeon]
MDEKQMKEIIDEYIMAYNNFDIRGMLKNLTDDVEFKNIANNQVNLQIMGKNNLKKQAEQAVKLFKERKMEIVHQKIDGDRVKNNINFRGILARDIPDGPKAGESIEIHGKSIFKFQNGKIISIEDVN